MYGGGLILADPRRLKIFFLIFSQRGVGLANPRVGLTNPNTKIQLVLYTYIYMILRTYKTHAALSSALVDVAALWWYLPFDDALN